MPFTKHISESVPKVFRYWPYATLRVSDYRLLECPSLAVRWSAAPKEKNLLQCKRQNPRNEY